MERKGRGHPDTLTDGLAERLSARYCGYTADRFGSILNHNFDKVGLLGGQSSVEFGRGRMLRPVRVLLNGRAADRFGEDTIPLRSLLTGWAREFLTQELPLLNPDQDLEFHFNVSSANTAGYPADDFTPSDATDRRQLHELRSSDTAVTVLSTHRAHWKQRCCPSSTPSPTMSVARSGHGWATTSRCWPGEPANR